MKKVTGQKPRTTPIQLVDFPALLIQKVSNQKTNPLMTLSNSVNLTHGLPTRHFIPGIYKGTLYLIKSIFTKIRHIYPCMDLEVPMIEPKQEYIDSQHQQAQCSIESGALKLASQYKRIIFCYDCKCNFSNGSNRVRHLQHLA